MFDDEFEKRIHEGHKRLDDDFRRLCMDPCSTAPQVGSRVVVAVGLLNMGHPWIREEGVVVEVGSTTYRVKFNRRYVVGGDEVVKWIHQALIIEVLEQEDE